jgi:dCTP diphosphatase
MRAPDDHLDGLIEELRDFVCERDWAQFHDPKNLAMLVASEAGELLAEYRWVPNADADRYSADPEARARIEAEVADVGIALLLLCDRLGINFSDALRRKLETNRRNYPADVVRGSSERPADR